MGLAPVANRATLDVLSQSQEVRHMQGFHSLVRQGVSNHYAPPCAPAGLVLGFLEESFRREATLGVKAQNFFREIQQYVENCG